MLAGPFLPSKLLSSTSFALALLASTGLGCGGIVRDDVVSADGGAVLDGAGSCGVGACTIGETCSPRGCTECTCTESGWSCMEGFCLDTGVASDGPVVCPAAEPDAGTFCDESEKCSYKSACGEDVAYCNMATLSWQIEPASCAKCPKTEPASNSACSDKLHCTYTNACGGTDVAACFGVLDGKWSIEHGDCPGAPPCPDKEPAMGSTCASGLSCMWNNGCGNIDYGFCDSASGWVLKDAGCALGCPSSMPTLGSACTSAGGGCTYVASKHCTTTCSCSPSGTWACGETCSDPASADAGAGGAPPPSP